MRGFFIAAVAAALVSPVSAHADLWTYSGQSMGTDFFDGDTGTLSVTIFYDTVAGTESATAHWVDSAATLDFVMAAQSPASPITLDSTTATGSLAGHGSGQDSVGLNLLADITTTPPTIDTTFTAGDPYFDGDHDIGSRGVTVTLTGVDTSVPEPASIALLLSGLFGLRVIRRRC